MEQAENNQPSPSEQAFQGDIVPTEPAAGAVQPAPAAPAPVYVAPAPSGKNGLATAALVLGILAIVLVWIPLFIGLILGWVLGLLAIIFGGIGISRAGKVGVGKGAAIAGLVLGIITIVLTFFGVGTLI